jgi:hypothetical protein
MTLHTTWILSNFSAEEVLAKNPQLSCYNFGEYCLFGVASVAFTKTQGNTWLREGYIAPRLNENIAEQSDFLNTLWCKHGDEFINRIKGNFTLIQINENGFNVYSDRFAVKKFFYWQAEGKFIISNNLKAINKVVKPQVSNESIAIYALTYHYIGGQTLFKNVHFNQPAQVITFDKGSLSFSTYWSPLLLLNSNNKATRKEVAQTLERCIEQYLAITKERKLSLSLTAGVDSRLLYSVLLNKNQAFHTYTYGSKESVDSVIASKLAAEGGVQHSNYDFLPTKETFKNFAARSVELGQSICSLHRAHRLWAVEQEAEYASSMLVGTMGGEFVKGSNRDDYIVSNFIYEFAQNKSKEVIKKYLLLKGIRTVSVDIDFLHLFFSQQEWCLNSEHIELYNLTYIAAGIHHAQNDTLYSNFFDTIITPYTDIDYLEALFASEFVYLKKRRIRSKFKQRLWNHHFSTFMQNYFNKEFAQIPYNSGFKASEFKAFPLLAVLLARLRKRKYSGKSNFALGGWMKEFVVEEISNINKKDDYLRGVFNTEELLGELSTSQIKTTEAFWLKYTTPIQIKLTIDIFK